MRADDPTPEEIAKVAAFWERVAARACSHPEMVLTHLSEGWTCSECGRPVRVLSDIQIDDLRKGSA